MHLNRRRLLGALLMMGVGAGTTACDNFLEVENPAVVDATSVDAETDAEVFSLSAQTSLFTAVDNLAVYGAWFNGEAWVDDTFDTRNEIALRIITDRNPTVTDDMYIPLARALAASEETVKLLRGTSRERSISTARAYLMSGYALIMMGEHFCQGVIKGQAPLTQPETFAAAAARFDSAISIGSAVGTSAAPVVSAARVGLARARLNVGEFALAIAAATPVTGFGSYDVLRIDDPSNRGRLGNTVYDFTVTRNSLVVPDYFRALNDTRVTSARATASSVGQGGRLPFFRQTKYTSYAAGFRLASGLEARYIIAEAQLKLGNPAPAQALVTERVAAGGTNRVFDATRPLLVQLLDLRARDFYLEAQQQGSWYRNGADTPYVLRAGDQYYISTIDQRIGEQRCVPIPAAEKDFNEFFPKA